MQYRKPEINSIQKEGWIVSQRKLVIGATMAVVVTIAAMGISWAHVTRGSSQPPNQVNTRTTSGTSSVGGPKAKALANGLLQPASPTLVSQITDASVRERNGKVESLPTGKPILFFAYWCTHCHDAISQLEKTGYSDKVNYVSVDMQFAPKSTAADLSTGIRLTDGSFAKLKMKEPGNMYFSLPNDALDTALTSQPIPFLLIHTKSGWYAMSGAPANESVWKMVFQYAAE